MKVIDSLAASLFPGRADVQSGLLAARSDVRQGVPGSFENVDEGHPEFGRAQSGIGTSCWSCHYANQQQFGQKRHV